MKIGLCQMNISWENKELNKNTCLRFFKIAAQKKVDLLIFPEMTLTGFTMNVETFGDRNSETLDWFSDKSRSYSINTVFGYTTFKDKIGENKLSVVSDKGIEIGSYTKIHPFSSSLETMYYKGGNIISAFNMLGFTISTFICYDLRFPEVFQIASRKADLIIVIANWPETRREQWITLLKARAIENQCYIAAVNRVGCGKDINYSGDSMIIDPIGNVLASENMIEALITCDIYNDVYNLREHFNVKGDRKESLYAEYFNRKGDFDDSSKL